MEKTYQIVYFISFVISFVMIFYLFTKSNFEKCFKQGKVEAIKVATFVLAFILATLVALGMKNLMECIYEIIH